MKVTIQPGCISCGTCELIAPEIFVVEVSAQVRPECLQQDCLQAGCAQQRCLQQKCLSANVREKIKRAASLCPVGVIVIDDENEGK